MLNVENLLSYPVIYGQRGLFKNPNKRLQLDVRVFIDDKNAILEEIIRKYNLKGNTFNETQWKIQKFVVSYLRYVYDEKSYRQEEFWQFPFETIYNGIGDCEDGQILMTSLMRIQGIPSDRVMVQQGMVKPEPTAPEGGHQWTIYKQDLPNGKRDWVILDWCFYPDPNVPVEQKKLLREGGFNNTYKDVWFAFNDEVSLQNRYTNVSTGRISKVSEKQVFLKEYDTIDEFEKYVFTEQKGKFDLMNNQYLTEYTEF